MAEACSYLTSKRLDEAGFRHAFFTRNGGVSLPPFDTLSFAASVGDDPAHVAENISRAATALGVSRARLYYASQVHGVDAVVLDGSEDREEVIRRIADITVSRTAGIACGVRSADCVPILIGDRRTGAVTAIHSGWRGTVQNVAAAGVAALRALAGKGDFVAAIGPHIEACCFEVGEDVARDLAACSPLGDAAIVRTYGEKPHVDLRRVVRAQLEACGIEAGAIDDVSGCTVCDRDRFHSYRRDGKRSGRMLSAIVAL